MRQIPESPVTISAAVHRAVEAVDPTGTNTDVGEFLARLEDDDEPITAVEDVEQRLAEEVGRLDPESEDPELQMAYAVAVYLAFRRDEVADSRDHLLRLAARAEFEGRPPENVTAWLREQGIEV